MEAAGDEVAVSALEAALADAERLAEAPGPVGCASYRVVLYGDFRLPGSSYKFVKTLLYTSDAGEGEPPLGGLVHVSPLVEAPAGEGPARLVARWWRGWLSEGPERGGLLLRGGVEYVLRIGWAGREGEEAASQLDSLLGASKLAEVELLELEYLSAPSDPVGLVEVALATPAQFKVVDWDGNPAIVASPDPGRLFKAAADALSDGDVVASNAARLLLAVFTAQVGGQWFPATVYLDDSRPTNWAVAGWARVAATRGAPLLVPRLLNMLHAATLYVGVGKSRFEGFGLAGVPLAGNPSLVKVPCIPWPLKAAHALQPRQARGPARRGGRRPGRTGPP